MERITSPQNSKIKNLISLYKANCRREQRLFIVEGFKEIKLALGSGLKLNSLFWCPSISNEIKNPKKNFEASSPIYEITSEIFAKIAYREKSDGLLAVFHQRDLKLENLDPEGNSLVIVIESVEKPGNLGAILRTADAASVFAVLICEPKTDIFNPNVIRSSIGCVFTNRIVSCNNDEALKWLKKHKFRIYSSVIAPDSKPYYMADYNRPTAFIMGTEDKGLSKFWFKNCDEKIIIPMSGKIDSLNVSASAAILIFEAIRQKRHNSND